MTVGSLAITGKRRDAVRVGEGACLAVDLAFQSWVEEQTMQCAVDTGDGQVTHELIVDGLVMVAEGEDGDKGARRQMVMGAETAAVMDDEGRVAHLQRVAEEGADVFHTGIGEGVG